jgi:hypothetical protein
MGRRFAAVALAAALCAPMAAIAPPAEAAVLFSCGAIDDGSFADLAPGLHHDQMAQTDISGAVFASSCSNGETAAVFFGTWVGLSAVTSYASRPLGCAVASGGAGPDYADQTPILLGPNDPSFSVNWGLGGNSSGVAKLKSAGPAASSSWKIAFNLTAGKYAPPPGQKTKIKGSVNWTPFDSFVCTDNSDPIESVDIVSGSVIVKQA